jgi:hypothetical protein
MFDVLILARGPSNMSDESLEAPEADTVEQETDAVPEPLDPLEPDDDSPEFPLDFEREVQLNVPLEADPADAVEQGREVDIDEDDDYR